MTSGTPSGSRTERTVSAITTSALSVSERSRRHARRGIIHPTCSGWPRSSAPSAPATRSKRPQGTTSSPKPAGSTSAAAPASVQPTVTSWLADSATANWCARSWSPLPPAAGRRPLRITTFTRVKMP